MTTRGWLARCCVLKKEAIRDKNDQPSFRKLCIWDILGISDDVLGIFRFCSFVTIYHHKSKLIQSEPRKDFILCSEHFIYRRYDNREQKNNLLVSTEHSFVYQMDNRRQRNKRRSSNWYHSYLCRSRSCLYQHFHQPYRPFHCHQITTKQLSSFA